jgi:ArsR family transcriptional regulator
LAGKWPVGGNVVTTTGIYEIQAELCRTMANPIRLEIVHLLREGSKCVSEIVQETGHPQSMVSRHLGILRNGNVVTAQRRAQDVYYQIANPKIVNICNLMREVLAEEASHRSTLVEGFSNGHSG